MTDSSTWATFSLVNSNEITQGTNHSIACVHMKVEGFGWVMVCVFPEPDSVSDTKMYAKRQGIRRFADDDAKFSKKS